jgi:hypothetical protein
MVGVLVLLVGVFRVAVAEPSVSRDQDDVVGIFKKAHDPNRYVSVNPIVVNSRHYVLALWNERGNPILLRGDIFQYDSGGPEKFRKVYSGDLSEEVIGAYAFSVDGTGREQLFILSNSGHLKVVRILDVESDGSLKMIFENGGADATLLTDSRELWIKDSVAGRADVYQWDQKKGSIRHARSVPVTF